jgi:hypothetical protein
MLRATAAGAFAAVLLVACGGAREEQRATPVSTEAGTAQSGDHASNETDRRGCPHENWPGPWSACAEADWVREVVRRAGYANVGDTGGALVASTDETGFYIWTTTGTTATLHDRGERLGTVAGTPVYGDERLWRIWSAQGFVLWTKAGPSGTDVALSMTALEPLIEASNEVPPPPA